MAHLGHGSRVVHRAYARSASRVTLPLEYYEAARDKKLIDFQEATANIQAAKPHVASAALTSSPSIR